MSFHRIVIVGTSGSGKSTLAARIAQRFGHQRIELDALHWADGWSEVPDEVFVERLRCATRAPRWVIDGNYERFREYTWERADLVVWLDYSFARTLAQVTWRTGVRVATRQRLWGTSNRESLRRALSRDSIIYWMITTWHTKRQRYRHIIVSGDHGNARFVRLTHPREANALLEEIARSFEIARRTEYE